jgi:hypothetical protein
MNEPNGRITSKELLQKIGDLFTNLADTVRVRIEATEKGILSIEARVAALEARQTMNYRGIWKADESYRAGNIATHAGALWFAWVPTHETPGKSDDWQLMHKPTRSER